ncbi:hypothetical protein BGX23_003333, partial [Mortierella sp. AD031]
MTKTLQDARPPGSDNLAAPIRTRDKLRGFFGGSTPKPTDKPLPSLPAGPNPLGTRSNASTEDKTVVSIVSTNPVSGPRQYIFFTNVAKPSIRTELPKKQDCLDKTPQLVYCTSLLPRDGSLLSPATAARDQDETLDEKQRAWLREMEQDSIEQDHIRWLGTRMVEEFIKDPSKDSVEISEIVLLGPVLQKEHYRRLISCTIAEFEKSLILDVDLLQGLVQLVQSASPGFLVSDDLVKILSILRT